MARLAVLHNTLDLRGGADAVCLHVCEALGERHDVTLFTLSRSSVADLNDYFGTDASVDVVRPPGTAAVARAFDAAADRLGPLLAPRSVLLDRFVRRRLDGFDAAVSTANEFALPVPTVGYVHFPQFNVRHAEAGDAGRLDALWSALAGVGDRSLPPGTRLLANSGWTADVVERIYGRRPDVLFPPVDPHPDPRAWANREDGVVSVGRLAPDKRPLEVVRVVDGVRRRGHDVHLHLVGSAPPAYRSYVERVRAAAAARPHVRLETDASRERVTELLGSHKYGLNAKPDEHFGMAVAEYVAAGMAVVAPNAGGQREVLDGDPDSLYDSVGGAVETLAAAVERDQAPTRPRDRYASARFHRRVREAVDRLLDGSGR
jgi:glycosyltransferase involved in cell wall biosynthesis